MGIYLMYIDIYTKLFIYKAGSLFLTFLVTLSNALKIRECSDRHRHHFHPKNQ